MRRTRLLIGTGFAALVIAFTAGAASAHVTPDPATAPKGAGDQEFTFRVPNEMDKANTVKFELSLDQTHPIAAVDVLAMPGWTSSVTMRHLTTPIKTDDGSFSDVASVITWTGGKIAPGEYGEFKILAMGLPDDTDSLVFKAIQIYDNNQEVSWIQTDPGAEHPAPIVKLTAAESDQKPAATSSNPTTPVKPVVTKSSDSSNGVAVGALVVAIISLLVAGGAILLARRAPNPTAEAP